MKTKRSWRASPSARHSLRTIAAIVSAVSVAALAACTGGGGTAPEEDNSVLVVAQATPSVSFAGCALGSFQCEAVYDELLTSIGSLDHSPGLITEWEYSDDRTVLHASLREGVEFSDGEPFNAEAVKANYEYYQSDEATDPIFGTFLASLSEVVVTGEHSVDFMLSTPDPWFEWRLGHIGMMMSPAALEDPDSLVATPVGSGPYVLDADTTQTDVEYHYVRNENYWNKDAYPFDEVVVKIMPDPTARLNAVLAGEVDVAAIETTAGKHAEESGLEVFGYNAQWQGMYLLDVEGEVVPALADERVRQAINMAVDRQQVVDTILQGYGEVSNQPFHESWPYYDESLESEYAYDPEAARALLTEAGYPDGFELVIPTMDQNKDWMPFVKQSLADVGITVTYDEMPDFGAWVEAVQSGDYGAIIWGTTSLGSLDQRFNGDASPLRPFDWETRDPKMVELLDRMKLDVSDPEVAAEFANYIFELGITPTWAHKSILYAARPGYVVNHVGDLDWLRLWEIEKG